jgi:hydroxyacylglutathione hydrolase
MPIMSAVWGPARATGATGLRPRRERIPEPLTRLNGGDACKLLGLHREVMDVPGHTAGHIAYYCAGLRRRPAAVLRRHLFSGGCGRLFEGTPAQMLASLDALAALPGNTRCAARTNTP